MIETLEIKNFKSHRNTVMSFSSGINAIIGRPIHGKTNVIRALLWLFYNRPLSGDMLSDFIEGEGITEVSALLSGVPEIVSLKKRIKISKDGKSKDVVDSVYNLGEREFKGMNKGMPDVIQQAFNISELNIQEQFDQPYLVNSSAGEIAKTINRVTRQELADQLEVNLSKKVNQINKEVNFIKGVIGEKEGDLKRYDGIDAVDAVLSEAEDINRKIESLKIEEEYFIKSISSYELLMKEIEYLEQFIEVEDIVKEINDIKKEVEDSEDLFFKVKSYINGEEDKEKIGLLFNSLKGIIEEIDGITVKYNTAIDLCNLIDDYENKIALLNSVEKDRANLYEEYIIELKKSKQCPVCFSVIDSKIIEKIRREL